MAATALQRLGHLVGNSDYLESARRALIAGLPIMEASPTAAGQLLIALDMWLGPLEEWVLVGGEDSSINEELLARFHRTYLPNCVLAYRGSASAPVQNRSPHLDPLFANRSAVKGEPTLYICQNFTCQSPLVGVDAITEALAGAVPARRR
jgi:uncharacterized protein YyaL (SSP411 family)